MNVLSVDELRSSIVALNGDALINGQVAALPIAFGTTALLGADDLFEQYRRLRRFVYVEKESILDLTGARDEWDTDDQRSVHLAAVERRGNELVVVGAMRVIVQAERLPAELLTLGLARSANALPAQREFQALELPESADGAPKLVCEISRYIVEHSMKSRKLRIGRSLNAAVAHLILSTDIELTIAVVESWLTRVLAISGVSVERISPVKYLDKYKSENFVVRIDIPGLGKRLGSLESMVVLPARA